MRLLKNPVVVLVAFVLAHLALIAYGNSGIGQPMGDIPNAYFPWADFMLKTHIFLGLTQSWVYPYPNLLFVLAPAGIPNLDYQTAWLIMETCIDGLAMALLLFWSVDHTGSADSAERIRLARVRAGWYWALGLLLLGPVGISRLDSISIAIAVVAVVTWANAKPDLAAVWFAVATWIKVWPFLLVAGLAITAKRRLRVLIYGVATGICFLVVGLLAGDFRSVLGFVFEQSDRGIQIESPWATWWLWQGVAGVKGSGLYYDMGLLTFQVQGPGTVLLASLLGPVMYGAVAITLVLCYLAQRKATNFAQLQPIFAWTALTGVLDLIVFNKVGSPQYYGWLFVPVVIGILTQAESVPEALKKWRTVGVLVLALVALTGVVYPLAYDSILAAGPIATSILLLRNLLAIGLLVLGNIRLTQLAKGSYWIKSN